MTTSRFGVAIAVLSVLLAVFIAVQRLNAGQIVAPPLQNPDQLRFQLIGDEQIAGPDGRTIVQGWSVLVFKDRKGTNCYVAFKQGNSISAMQASSCPQ
jgi:hypothetical protein